MLTTLFLLAIQLGGALYMSAYMTQHAVLELLVLFAGLLLGVVVYYAEYERLAWSAKAGSAFYALSILNLGAVYFFYHNYLIQAVLLLFSLVGLARSIGSMDAVAWEDEYYETQFKPRLETYDSSEREQVVEADPMYVNLARDWRNAKSSVVSSTKKRGRPKGAKDSKPRKQK